MKTMQKTNVWQVLSFAAGCAAVSLLSGCGKEAQSAAEPEGPPPEVTIVTLKRGPVALTRELPGRAHAYLTAEVRPRVAGIVKRRLFTEGAFVEAGQGLYLIDDAAYRADLDSAAAAARKAQATLHASQLAAARARTLVKERLISTQESDNAIAAEGQARAEVGVAQAALQTSRINLGYARIVAPISGHIGKSSVTEGALVTADQSTPLATITRFDPIYVEINQPSSQWLSIKQSLASSGGGQDASGSPVKILLENGAPYEHAGKLQFADVTVDPTTGNVLLRAVVPNPDSTLLPGMYVRALVDEGGPRDVVLVPQQGIERDASGKARALVVGKGNKVEIRMVKVSRTVGDQWLVDEGLAAGDRVIVEGLQKVAPDMTVNPVERKATGTAGTAGASR